MKISNLVPLLLLAGTISHAVSFKVESAVERPGMSKNFHRGAKRAPTEKSPVGKQTATEASIANLTFNLVKSIVGVGVLSLPAGVAAFGDAPSALIPAAVLIIIMGILSAYGFSIIGRTCAYTGATSYREAWSKSVGEGSSWIPTWSATAKTFIACTAFSMVLADTFSTLLGTERNPTLIAFTALVLLPLCLLKNLKSLAPFSLVGVLGMAYTAVAMAVRYVDGTYVMPEGSLVAQVDPEFRPRFGNKGLESVFSPKSLVFVCMLSVAYLAHFSAPRFFAELKDNTMPRFNKVVSMSFGISILLMGLMTLLGFLTFGGNCAGVVLNNYAAKDLWISGSRIAVVVSLVFSYPLSFVGCRDGILDLIQASKEKRTPMVMNSLTLVMLVIVTFLACVLRDVKFVLASSGATLGNALTYVYPAIMYRSVVRNQGKGEHFGVALATFCAVLGIVMGAIGFKMSFK